MYKTSYVESKEFKAEIINIDADANNFQYSPKDEGKAKLDNSINLIIENVHISGLLSLMNTIIIYIPAR